MSLTKEFFERETNITAKVIADSISPSGQRITTLEIEYPRYILSELNTHGMLVKNSSSSRAIPIKTMIAQIVENGAVPLYWGKTKSGMQADGELEGHDLEDSHLIWGFASQSAISRALALHENGLHKQTTNRLLEPFQMMKTVITGTDWDNFFNLRIHPDAQPEFCMLAYKMYVAMKESVPTPLKYGEWHLPYVDSSHELSEEGFPRPRTLRYHTGEVGTDSFKYLTLEEAQRISASCTAQTSYRKSDDSLEKADKIFDMLIKADVLHASPFGHLATPVSPTHREWDLETLHSVSLWEENCVNVPEIPFSWEKGITHMNRGGVFCSGNLTGWISYRHLIPNNTCYEFDFEERMKLFSNGSVS